MAFFKKTIYGQVKQQIIWFIFDELVLKQIHIYYYLIRLPVYGVITKFATAHPHLIFLLGLII